MDPITQPDYVDGKLIHAGGGEIHLQEDGTIYKCSATAEMVTALQFHLNRSTLRVFGMATWMCRADGLWDLQAFSIENFTPLDDTTLEEVLQ